MSFQFECQLVRFGSRPDEKTPFCALGCIINKTTGYLRDILRSPTLLKMPCIRMKAFFFSKYSASSYFLNFPTLNSFWFLPKNIKNKVERHFQEKKSNETRSRKNLPHVAILKPIYFSEKPPNFKRFENSYYSSRILWQICYNLAKIKFHVQKRERTSF